MYRQQSFSKAAQIGITQPAVSQQIQFLESFIGKPLFVRLARGVAATEVADELANLVAASLDTLEQKLSGFRFGAVSGGMVHLAAPADCVHYQMVKVLQGLLSDGFSVRLQTGNRSKLYQLLESRCWCMPPHLLIKSAKRRIKSGCRNCLLSVSTRSYRV